MNAYPYLQQERKTDIKRRKIRVHVDLIFKNFERRQANNTLYNSFERRSGMDRIGNL